MINKIPLNGLNSIAARSFTRSSILNNIFRRSVNYLESGSIVHINSEESATHLVINKILLNQNINESICLIIILSYSIFSLSFKKTDAHTDSVNTITPLKFQD